MKIEIMPATLRDASYVAAHMRARDKEEIDPQLPDDMCPSAFAEMCLKNSDARYSYVCFYGGQPACVFGFQWETVSTLCAWAWGTEKMTRCVPALTRKIKDIVEEVISEGRANRVHVYALKKHKHTANWLESFGLTPLCELKAYGKNGEDFIFYEGVRDLTGSASTHSGERVHPARRGSSTDKMNAQRKVPTST